MHYNELPIELIWYILTLVPPSSGHMAVGANVPRVPGYHLAHVPSPHC